MDKPVKKPVWLCVLISLFAPMTVVGCGDDMQSHGEEVYFVESVGSLVTDSLQQDSAVRYWVQSIPLMQLQENRDYPLQAMVIYKDLLFQCYDKNPWIDVYDLSMSKILFTIQGDPAGSTHCNNADFSNIFYSPEDEFPLLYLEVRGNQHRTLVYRIEHTGDVYALKKIQTIKFTDCTWSTTTVDCSDSTLVVYHDDKNGLSTYSKVKIPDWSCPTVTIPLDADHCLSNMPVGSTRVGQDATIKYGRIYHLFGYANDCELRISDFTQGREITKVNLPRTGFHGEPEGIAFHHDSLIVTNLFGMAYRLNFTKQSNLQ